MELLWRIRHCVVTEKARSREGRPWRAYIAYKRARAAVLKQSVFGSPRVKTSVPKSNHRTGVEDREGKRAALGGRSL